MPICSLAPACQTDGIEDGDVCARRTGRRQRLHRLVVSWGVLCLWITSACVGPWPSATEDTTGLGNSEIARTLKDMCCAPSEHLMNEQIQLALKKANATHGPREAAESIGFACEQPPSLTCRYVGEMACQVHGAPKENTDAQKVHIVSYSIVLADYTDRNSIHAERKTSIVP
ncbi:MAG: hypothetical protein LZF60_230102 [Nitrospira sp.]|nr:MAG: hypothetical protein LZF60_230102 [Nitrospira sp.]